MHRRSLVAAVVALAGAKSLEEMGLSARSEAQASAKQPVQTPIRGTEDLGDLSRPEQALAQFYKAFANRDIALMQENWEQSDEAVLDNPLGGIKRGWPAIREVYERIFSSKARVTVEFYDYTVTQEGNVFWAVGRERGSLNTGSKTLQLAIRTSRVFRRRPDVWRQVHHHGSFDDAKLLAAYQEAVR